ncbi:MAG: Ezrin/radixin/moesin family protein [Cytophagales bacterium]
MKYFLIFFAFFTMLLNAQSNDDKEWAKKLKAMKPADLRRLSEEAEESKHQVEMLKNESESKRREIESLKNEVESLKQASQNSVKMPLQKNESDVSKNGFHRQKSTHKGVTFKVQIGAFRNKDLTKYFDNNPNFSGEVDSDGIKKYTLGYFNDYWEADTFKKYLREMGVKDAWVVPYNQKGERLNMRDVLEGIVD